MKFEEFRKHLEQKKAAREEKQSLIANLDLRVPDAVEPLTLIRSWRLTEQGELHSCHFPFVWPFGEPARAYCQRHERIHQALFGAEGKRPNHRVPEPTCTCGIYAATSIFEALRHPSAVVGFVKLWGKTLQYDKGARAETGYPSKLYVPVVGKTVAQASATTLMMYGEPHRLVTSETVPMLQERYGVPVELIEKIADVDWTLPKNATAKGAETSDK